jgi:hypothetical protein
MPAPSVPADPRADLGRRARDVVGAEVGVPLDHGEGAVAKDTGQLG